MRRRERNAVGLGLGAVSKTKCLKIVTRTVAIREEPGKFSPILCQLTMGIYVPSDLEKVVEGVVWHKLPCGWLCSMDGNGYESCVTANDAEGQRMWATEFDKRRRIAGAVTAMLTRSYSLPNARRVAKSIYKYITSGEMGPMMNLPDVSIEDLMVGLASCSGLKQGEILEFIKIAACQQCNPPKALKDIAADVLDLINMRPTLWISSDRNVLETLDVKSKNDQFVMSAARGDMRKFEQFLAIGQELAAVHSELKYTALHAAADFGQDDIARMLINMGLSPNIRDARKGQTPLHFGGQGGRSNICRLLMGGGADRSVRSYSGKLPYELASEQGFLECAEILKQPPPAVQFVAIIDFTTRTVSLHWEPPAIDPHNTAKITEYVIEWSPVGHFSLVGNGDRFVSKTSSFTLRGLRPATGHGFVILCNSFAGLSPPSSKIIQFTRSAPPDRPPTVEMLRVTTNGVFLSWLPPKYTNGAKLDRYQLELVECSKGEEIEQREREAKEKKLQAKRDRLARKKAAKMGGMGPLTPQRDAGSVGAGSLGSRVGDDLDVDDDDDDNESDREKEKDDDDDDAGWESDGDTESKDEGKSAEGKEKKEAEDQFSLSSSLKDAGSIAAPKKTDGGNDRNHRIFKVSATTQNKQCTGLEPWKPYQCRVRCHNALGYSDWSDWLGPVIPQPGVYVLDFDRENRSFRVGWFKPMLSAMRKVTAYEVQICNVMGPLLTTIPIFADKADKARIIGKNVALSFKTLASGLVINEYVVTELKAGSKYQVRVRCQVDREWLDWTLALLSDTILMPACAPERPFGLRPAKKVLGGFLDRVVSSESGIETEAGSEGDDKFQTQSQTQTATAENVNPEDCTATQSDSLAGDAKSSLALASAYAFEITHNTVQLQWTNGINNGAPVEEYQLEHVKVRDYRKSDLELAEIAAGVEMLTGGMVRQLKAEAGVGGADKKGGSNEAEAEEEGEESDEGEEEEEDEDGGGDEARGDKAAKNPGETQAARSSDESSLNWTNYTHRAALLGPQAFLVRGLLPGGAYIFRLRVRNEHGWSPWSLASPVITTFPCLPVGRPQVMKIQPYHVYIRWNEQGDGKSMGLTNLEYDVKIGKIPSGETQQTYSVTWVAAEVSPAPEWNRPTPQDGIDHAAALAVYNEQLAAYTRAKEELAAEKAAAALALGEEQTGGENDEDDEGGEEVELTPENRRDARAARQRAQAEAQQRLQQEEDEREANEEEGPGPAPAPSRFLGVMLNNLSPATDYCCRVRVRTVLGWSTWTEPSDTFRTLSQNA